MLCHAQLHLPSAEMAGCIHMAVERNTENIALTDTQRLNFHPASPFPTLCWVLKGKLHLLETPSSAPAITCGPTLSNLFISGPLRHPVITWSPGAVHMVMVALYPDVWSALLDLPIDNYVDTIAPLQGLPSITGQHLATLNIAPQNPFPHIEQALYELFQENALSKSSHDVRSWLDNTVVRATNAHTGTSERQVQRRLKQWTGQSQRDLTRFARVEEAFSLSTATHNYAQGWAALATDAGYSDQSHLGREVKKITGLSPAQLRERVKTDEAFWMYRLLGDYLQEDSQSS